MRRRHPAAVRTAAAALFALTALSACSQVGSGAKQAASDAAARATDQAKTKARDVAIGQVCGLTTGSGPLADGKLSANEKSLVDTVAQAAQQAGVPATYTDPLRTLATKQGDAVTKQAADQLKQACAGR